MLILIAIAGNFGKSDRIPRSRQRNVIDGKLVRLKQPAQLQSRHKTDGRTGSSPLWF